MIRYNLDAHKWVYGGYMKENTDGKFVKYEDVRKMLQLMVQYMSDISRKHVLDILRKEEINGV